MLAISLLAASATSRKDVLMLAVDDLRQQLSCTENPGTVRPAMHTPHLCNLAADSLVLQRSQVAVATCSPSRTALLTGRHATATHVWDLFSYFRNITGNFTTIPQHFKESGYMTAGMGKIFHPGAASGALPHGAYKCPACRGPDDADYSWSEPYFHGKPPVDTDNSASWLAYSGDDPLEDEQVRDHAVATLRNISSARASDGAQRPFFVAVGFHKPHLPFVFPARFLQYYPEGSISLPPNAFAPDGMPPIAWQSYGETRSYADIAKLHASGAPNTTLPDDTVRALRRAYYASVSFTDDNVGQVLAALRAGGLDGNTVVVFWGDHGWSLGEHGLWDKHTNFDIDTHAPVMFRVPGLTDGGVSTRQVSETVDIFPTLVELALGGTVGVCAEDSSTTTLCTEGTSLAPLITAPHRPVKLAAFSTYARGIPKTGEAAVDGAAAEAGAAHTTPSACLDVAREGRGCAMGYTMLTHLDGCEVRYTEWVHYRGPTAGWKPVRADPSHGGEGRRTRGHAPRARAQRLQPSARARGGAAGAHELALTVRQDWSTNYGVELYNHSIDPGENRNVFASVEGGAAAAQLKRRLHRNWAGNAPTTRPARVEQH